MELLAPGPTFIIWSVTTENLWMDHHHDLYTHNKFPDELIIYLADMISPVVSSQGFTANNHEAVITWKNKPMLVATDQGADLHPNGLMTHSDTKYFLIHKSVLNLPSKWYCRIINSTELVRSWDFPTTLVQRFES